jgi:predicted pyridoxine 5'-phosphate oxidase superfamily flavin-nucleotide-binding protein
MPFHEGELAMQRRAGVAALAQRVGRIIGDDLGAGSAAFLAQRRFVIAATIDATGAPHASLLGGAAGFVAPVDPQTLVVKPSFGDRAMVNADLAIDPRIGMLAIEFATKRRMRVNGTATKGGDAITVRTAEVYGNCPQYINASEQALARNAVAADLPEWLATSDTFFIASVHPARGADASHRGGPAGFVKLLAPATLAWPDYTGNNMFNTLGNLTVEPRCALLFVDFVRGAALEVRGRATVIGDTEREVRVDIDETRATSGFTALAAGTL